MKIMKMSLLVVSLFLCIAGLAAINQLAKPEKSEEPVSATQTKFTRISGGCIGISGESTKPNENQIKEECATFGKAFWAGKIEDIAECAGKRTCPDDISSLRRLTATNEVADLLVEIMQSGLVAGLEFQHFKPLAEISKDSYREFPIEKKITGKRQDLQSFIDENAQRPGAIKIDDVLVSRAPENESLLSMNATIRLYGTIGEKKPIKKETKEIETHLDIAGEFSGTFLKMNAEGKTYDTKPHRVLYRFGESGYLALKDNKWGGQVLVDPSVGVIGIYHTAFRDFGTGSLTMEPDQYLSGILIFTSDKSLRDPNGKETYKSGEFVKGFIKDLTKPERYGEGITEEKAGADDKPRFVFQRDDRPSTPSDRIVQKQIKWMRDSGY